jgi:hypothetical protein
LVISTLFSSTICEFGLVVASATRRPPPAYDELEIVLDTSSQRLPHQSIDSHEFALTKNRRRRRMTRNR